MCYSSDELAKLADLHQRGVLTDDEFARAKARILDASAPACGTTAVGDGIRALRRSITDRWFGGVCGGLARVTAMPSWIWRLIMVGLAVLHGTGVLIYALLWIFLPSEPAYTQPAPQAR